MDVEQGSGTPISIKKIDTTFPAATIKKNMIIVVMTGDLACNPLDTKNVERMYRTPTKILASLCSKLCIITPGITMSKSTNKKRCMMAALCTFVFSKINTNNDKKKLPAAIGMNLH